MDFDLNLMKNESSDNKLDNPEKLEQRKLKEKQARQIRNVKKWFNGIASGKISEDPNSKYFRRSDRPWTITERQQRYKDRQEYPIKEEQLLARRSSAAERQRQYRIRRKIKLEKIREILNFNGTNRLPDVPNVDAGFMQNGMDQDEDKSLSSQALNQKKYRQKIKLLLQQYEHLISEDSTMKEKPALTSAERQKRFQQKKKLMQNISNNSKKLILQPNDVVRFNLTRNDLDRLSSQKKIVKLIPKEEICKLLKTKSFNDNVKNKIQSQISPKEKKIVKLIPKDEIHKYIILDNTFISTGTNIVNKPGNSKTVTNVNGDNMNGNISSHSGVHELKPTILDSNTKYFENILRNSTLPNSTESLKIEEANIADIKDLEEPNDLLDSKASKNKSGENQRNYRQRLKNKLELERLANNTVREEIIKQLQRERQRRYRERKKQAKLMAKSSNDSVTDSNEHNSNSNSQFKENYQLQEISIVKLEPANSDMFEDFSNYQLESTSDSPIRGKTISSKPAERTQISKERKKPQNNKLTKTSISELHSKINNNDRQLSSQNSPMTPAERMRKYRLRKKLKQILKNTSEPKKSLVDEPQVSLEKFGKFNLKYDDGSTVAFNYESEEYEQSLIETDPLQIEGICSS